jgi:riboflavin synthase
VFTGLVERKGKIVRIEKENQGANVQIKPLFPLESLKTGDSIAIDGACLTVIKFNKDNFEVEVSPETLLRTTFRYCQPGKEINLEQALRLGDRLGGHLVTGHIDTIGIVKGKKEKGSHIEITFTISKQWMRYIVEKGSVAVDGVSLTVNCCFSGSFEVNIIPHTAKVTTLGKLEIGNKVNIETDLIGKYVYKFLSPWKEKGLTEDFLKEHGFW